MKILTYGHRRYMYSMSKPGFIEFASLTSTAFRTTAVIIIDPYGISQRFGKLSKFTDVPDDAESQPDIRFFGVMCFCPYQNIQ